MNSRFINEAALHTRRRARPGPRLPPPASPRHRGRCPRPVPDPGAAPHGPPSSAGTAAPLPSRGPVRSRPLPCAPRPAAKAQPACPAPHLRVDGRAHAGEGVRRGRVVGEAVPGRGSAAAAGGGRLVLSGEALVHHVGSVGAKPAVRCGAMRWWTERPWGGGEEGGRLRASLCPVRAARLSAPPPGLPLLLEYCAAPPFCTLPPTSYLYPRPRARGGSRPPRARPAPPSGPPRAPPPAGERSREGREAAAGTGGAPRAAREGRGGRRRSSRPPRGVVRPDSGTH